MGVTALQLISFPLDGTAHPSLGLYNNGGHGPVHLGSGWWKEFLFRIRRGNLIRVSPDIT